MPKITLLSDPYPGREDLTALFRRQMTSLGIDRATIRTALSWSLPTISKRICDPTSMTMVELYQLCKILKIQPERAFLLLRTGESKNSRHWLSELAQAAEGR